MKFDLNYMFWVVVTPKPDDTLDDVAYQANLPTIIDQVKTGLDPKYVRLTLYTDRGEAMRDANLRLDNLFTATIARRRAMRRTALDALKQIADGIEEASAKGAVSISDVEDAVDTAKKDIVQQLVDELGRRGVDVRA